MDEPEKTQEEILKEAYARLFFKYTVLHPNKPLDKEQMMSMMALLQWDTQNVPVQLEESYVKTVENPDLRELYNVLMTSTGAMIIYSRLRAIGIEIAIPAVVWLASFIKTPGEAVIYAHYVAYKVKRRDLGNLVTMAELCQHCFPWGTFTEKQEEEIWATNKVPLRPDNLLDYPMAWEFIGL